MITIVIIIILASVTINFTFGDNGLITRAQQAKEQMEISSIKERLELAVGVAYLEGEGVIDPDYYFTLIEGEGIIVDRYADVVEIEDGTYEITTEQGYVFEITLLPNKENPTNMEIEYIGKEDNLGPRIREIKTNTTTNSISIEVEARDAEGGTYTYSYKKAGEENWIEAETSENNTCTIEGLEAGATYTVQVKLETANGEVIKEKEVTVGEMPGKGTITFGETEWQGDGTASIKIETSETGYTLQYQKNSYEGSWTDIESGEIIEGLQHGDTVYGRLWDGTNGSEYASADITDDIPPEVNISTSNLTYNSVTLNVTAVDRQSGLAETGTYKYYLGNNLQATNEMNSYTFTGLTDGLQYTLKVVVTDKAGKTTEKSTTITTIGKTIENVLEEGNYVNFVDKTGTTRTCVVLYGPENANYSDYGIQIITMETVENIELGNGTGNESSAGTENDKELFNIARDSYNNAISILNKKSEYYLNPTFASSARSVGSVPDDPDYDGAEMYTSSDSYMESYNGIFKDTDENYLTDYNKMETLGVRIIGETYWLASRLVYFAVGQRTHFYVRNELSTGGLDNIGGVCGVDTNRIGSKSLNYGLRPVFTLKSGLKIIGGSGIKNDPYTLGV